PDGALPGKSPHLIPKWHFHVSSSMHNAKNQHVVILDTVNDDVFAHGKTTRANAKLVFAGPAQIWVAGKKKKSVSDGINQLVGDFDAAALGGDVIPDTVEVGRSLWC